MGGDISLRTTCNYYRGIEGCTSPSSSIQRWPTDNSADSIIRLKPLTDDNCWTSAKKGSTTLLHSYIAGRLENTSDRLVSYKCFLRFIFSDSIS